MKGPIKLDIMSDPICPWCYIGKSYLDRALSSYPDHPLVIEWHPFQLNPDMPAKGMNRRIYLEKKFGGKDGAIKAYTPILENVRKAGLKINFEKMRRTPNTFDAHRLIHWSGIEGKQTAVVSALFKSYFFKALDIGNHDVLVDIAASIDMDSDVVRKLLLSNADRSNITARDTHSRKIGVNSVPTFVVNGKYVVSGAQPPELWAKVISEMRQKET